MGNVEQLKRQITSLPYPEFIQIWEHCAQERPTRDAMEQTAPIVQQGCVRELRGLYPDFDPTTGGQTKPWAHPENWATAYIQHDTVTHNNHTWRSLHIGPNLWEPGTQGAEHLWAEVANES